MFNVKKMHQNFITVQIAKYIENTKRQMKNPALHFEVTIEINNQTKCDNRKNNTMNEFKYQTTVLNLHTYLTIPK